MTDPAPTVSARTIAMHIEHAGPAAWQTASSERQPGPASPPAASRAARMVAWAREAYSYEAVRLLCEAARSCLAQVEEFAAQVDFSFGRPGSYEEHAARLQQLQDRAPRHLSRVPPSSLTTLPGDWIDAASQCMKTAAALDQSSPWVVLYSGLTMKARGDLRIAAEQLQAITASCSDIDALHHSYRNLCSCLVDGHRTNELLPWVTRAEQVAPDDPAWSFFRLALSGSAGDAAMFETSRDRLIELCPAPDRQYWLESIKEHSPSWAAGLGTNASALAESFDGLNR